MNATNAKRSWASGTRTAASRPSSAGINTAVRAIAIAPKVSGVSSGAARTLDKTA